MNGKVKVLKDEVIGKIAAGEVVERPASAVKELVENSIDAGADSIFIDIEEAGSKLIRIADNGSGIDPEDMEKICLKYSTSKLENIEDLDNLRTLGFRGEALSSISSVSQFTVISNTTSGEEGHYLYVEDGNIKELKPHPRSKGTTIEASNLFYNVPARRKFLKTNSTEMGLIVDIVGRFILSNEKIEFKLTHNGKTVLYAAKEKALLDRIKEVMGKDIADNMLELFVPGDHTNYAGKLKIRGFISKPSITRKDKNYQTFFVNGRYVRNNTLSNALYGAYFSMLERGRYPLSVLFIEIDPSEIDVNIHPSKLLIKFQNEKYIKDTLVKTIKETFEHLRDKQSTIIKKSTNEKLETKEWILPEELQKEFLYPENLDQKKESKRDNSCAGYEHLNTAEASFRQQTPIFQVAKCFIVQVKKDGLYIIDQHAAHERILFEYFSKRVKNNDMDKQNLLFPLRLDLSTSDAAKMDDLMKTFNLLGFEINSFGDNSFIVQTIPPILKNSDIKTVIMDMLSDMAGEKNVNIDPVENMIKYASCRGAIKEGDELTIHEMQVLIRDMENSELPFTCPHGRPTAFDLGAIELEKMFRRK
ncbi:MAG: DNA mismatch repair endonuclease MutL [Candidatus Omnitrophica bacterium]|nr:DNA mismatch repair endonuclease MutL [Candidatus Omnitrophota bacterium]